MIHGKSVSKERSVHPLDPLTHDECTRATKILRDAYPDKLIHIKNIQAEEPPKATMLRYLDAEHSGYSAKVPPRVAFALYYILTDKVAEIMTINLDTGNIIEKQAFPHGSHPPIDMVEAITVEKSVMENQQVKEALKSLGIPAEDLSWVRPDAWMYGCDREGLLPRYSMYIMYMGDPKTKNHDSNYYSRPLPLVPVWDVLENKLERIDWCASGGEGDDRDQIRYDTRNAEQNILQDFKSCDYMPELRADAPLRTDVKPYNVVQPEGPSFTVDGRLVKWQKWSFRVGFNAREGLVLQDVRYDGRTTFYRLSVSEMTVPYGDPRPPLHRKQAFDLGDIGAGYAANSLGLGCDCLGTIKYFDCNLVLADGSVVHRPNVVCMHEQDDGILWKHTNYRTQVCRVARRRVLVLQTVLTVGNYEYVFAWHFDQAANIELEVRATGILSTQYIDPDKTSRWGTVVSPSVLAASHQHIFSMRIDPAIDGQNNTVAVCDTKLDPYDELNPYGTGFYNSTEYIETSQALDAKPEVNRYLKLVNESKINPITKSPISYKLSTRPTALLMARPGTVARERARFATHHFWVSKYRDGEFFAGGVWTNQSSKEIGGVQDAVDRREPVRNEDVVLWHSFGLTHHPRIEDFPVMPVEKLTIGLHPNGFFTENPAIDVPPSTQVFNRSVEILENKCCHRM